MGHLLQINEGKLYLKNEFFCFFNIKIQIKKYFKVVVLKDGIFTLLKKLNFTLLDFLFAYYYIRLWRSTLCPLYLTLFTFFIKRNLIPKTE